MRLSARKLAEMSFNDIGIWTILIFTKIYASFGSQARRSVTEYHLIIKANLSFNKYHVGYKKMN